MNIEEYLSKASPILRSRMKKSIALLQKAEKLAKIYDPQDGYYLAFSGGKDSQALYHLAQLSGVKFKAHFSPTTVDPPQVIRFIRRNYPDVEFKKVTRSIYQQAIREKLLPTMIIRWCCRAFKESSGAGKVTLIGIRRAESTRRSKRNEVEITGRKFSGNLEQLDEYRKQLKKPSVAQLENIDKEMISGCITGKDSLLISPILEWTDADVWEFLNKVVEVNHCELYDRGRTRIGCILCPMSSLKHKKQDITDFPYVREKWIQAIKEMGGFKEFESPEDVFEWWISGKNIREWFADKSQKRLDL